MDKNYYSLEGKGTKERKELFESDPKAFMYSMLHSLVDMSFELVESHEEDLDGAFFEALPFEMLTQLIEYMTGIFKLEDIFDHIHYMEELLLERRLNKNVQ